jgi:hypothetical protein
MAFKSAGARTFLKPCRNRVFSHQKTILLIGPVVDSLEVCFNPRVNRVRFGFSSRTRIASFEMIEAV